MSEQGFPDAASYFWRSCAMKLQICRVIRRSLTSNHDGVLEKNDKSRALDLCSIENRTQKSSGIQGVERCGSARRSKRAICITHTFYRKNNAQFPFIFLCFVIPWQHKVLARSETRDQLGADQMSERASWGWGWTLNFSQSPSKTSVLYCGVTMPWQQVFRKMDRI